MGETMRKFIVATVIALGGASASCAAYAANEDWAWFANGTSGSSFSYHLPRTKFLGSGRVETWMKVEGKTPFKIFKDNRPDTASSALYKRTIYCKNNSLTVDQVLFYDKKGSVVHSASGGGMPEEAAPDTIDESLVQTICADQRAN
jgi:hypothetical protein